MLVEGVRVLCYSRGSTWAPW